MTLLVGRRAERERVEQVIALAASEQSQVLVLRGEAGIGKTVLLEHARDVAAAAGFQVQPVVGAEAEAQFAFAGLHQLCAPLLDRAAALPDPQQQALHVAFGLRDGPAPDRFLVGLAVLHLLAEVAESTPLLCLVDDAQWLDPASAQVLAFVSRRVAAEPMALVFAVRDGGDGGDGAGDPIAGLPEVRLDGLGEDDARTLLADALVTPLVAEVRDRIVAEARGNPLALLELPRGVDLARGYELPAALSVPHRVEDSFRRRSATLPTETQLLLLVAAAEPTGDPALLWRAADHLGITHDAAAPAEAVGLLEIGPRVRFPHPLARSAVYRAATPPDQRRAHGALAAVTDAGVEPDRRAWHRGHAVLGTDEDAAADLERSAGRARARGGLAASAAFLRRAMELTPEPDRRAGRALEAAYASYEAFTLHEAGELLTVAAAGPLDARQAARLVYLQAQIAFLLSRDGDAPNVLLEAAATLAPLDPSLSRRKFMDALNAAVVAGGLRDGRTVRDVAEAARAAPPPPGPPGPADLLLDGLVTTLTHGYAAGFPGLRDAVAAFHAHDARAQSARPEDNSLAFAISSTFSLFDDESLDVLTDRWVSLAREAGSLAGLYGALLLRAICLVLTGRLAQGAELAAEQTAVGALIGGAELRHARVLLAAWSGDEAELTTLRQASEHAGGVDEVRLAHHAQAVLHNGRGNYPAALQAAEGAGGPDELWYPSHALPEIVEAASRAGRPQRAVEAARTLSARAAASGTEWGLGLAARCRALTSAAPEAEEHHREAVQRLGRCRVVVDLARAHLVYGEWLRREGRRQDARDQLRTAHTMLSDMGAAAFAERAARELRATGERPRKRAAQQADALTVHELQVARLVATGATSREVATQLFLSPRTIEAHLRSIFSKLGITSRRQLRELPLP